MDKYLIRKPHAQKKIPRKNFWEHPGKNSYGPHCVEEMPFNKASFWVQAHKIPVRYSSQKVVEGIYETIGLVNQVSNAPDSNGGGFWRV